MQNEEEKSQVYNTNFISGRGTQAEFIRYFHTLLMVLTSKKCSSNISAPLDILVSAEEMEMYDIHKHLTCNIVTTEWDVLSKEALESYLAIKPQYNEEYQREMSMKLDDLERYDGDVSATRDQLFNSLFQYTTAVKSIFGIREKCILLEGEPHTTKKKFTAFIFTQTSFDATVYKSGQEAPFFVVLVNTANSDKFEPISYMPYFPRITYDKNSFGYSFSYLICDAYYNTDYVRQLMQQDELYINKDTRIADFGLIFPQHMDDSFNAKYKKRGKFGAIMEQFLDLINVINQKMLVVPDCDVKTARKKLINKAAAQEKNIKALKQSLTDLTIKKTLDAKADANRIAKEIAANNDSVLDLLFAGFESVPAPIAVQQELIKQQPATRSTATKTPASQLGPRPSANVIEEEGETLAVRKRAAMNVNPTKTNDLSKQ